MATLPSTQASTANIPKRDCKTEIGKWRTRCNNPVDVTENNILTFQKKHSLNLS